MFVNKEELIQFIVARKDARKRLQNQDKATYSYYAGGVEALEDILARLDFVETIEGPKRERKVKDA